MLCTCLGLTPVKFVGTPLGPLGDPLLALLNKSKVAAMYRMPIADNSRTEKLRHLRSRTLANFRRQSSRAREEGPGGVGTEDEVRSSRAQGQLAYTVQLVGVVNGSSTSKELPCCPVVL